MGMIYLLRNGTEAKVKPTRVAKTLRPNAACKNQSGSIDKIHMIVYLS
jgi:hypothetical protein